QLRTGHSAPGGGGAPLGQTSMSALAAAAHPCAACATPARGAAAWRLEDRVPGTCACGKRDGFPRDCRVFREAKDSRPTLSLRLGSGPDLRLHAAANPPSSTARAPRKSPPCGGLSSGTLGVGQT